MMKVRRKKEELRRLPIERCAALYRADGRNFLDIVQEHLENGIVVDTPECFAMGKAVKLQDGRKAWLVTAAAGDLGAIVRAMPWPLPFVAFYRRGRLYKTDPSNKCGRLHVYPTQKFIQRVLLLVMLLLAFSGCEIWNGLRIANNPNNYNGQWNHDSCR